ncbi:nucleoside transporter-domain-containing protein [Myxozyma melibiosi]|uniref:Nucleoside transporter-domain-containing protein n=1 Tax=Myxozyma melibiosi TaxID=54550 RepID=A0ABR1FDF6_9ASCO
MTDAVDPASLRLLRNSEPSPLYPASTATTATSDFDDDHRAANALNSLESGLDDDRGGDAHAKMMQHAKETYNSMDYWAFLLLGLAMLWPWNCFLSAAAYFQDRFKESEFLRENFQSFMMTTSTITATLTMLYLSHQQQHASYTFRIWLALILNAINFTILAIASITEEAWHIVVYFIYLLISVFFSACATSLSQNGAFAIANLFTPVYTQGIMVGQAIAGVLPSIAQIISVVSVESSKAGEAGKASSASSFVYFLTATGVTVIAIFFYISFYRRQRAVINHGATVAGGYSAPRFSGEFADIAAAAEPEREYIPLTRLLKKLYFAAFAVFFTFGLTLMFPVFASTTLSVNYVEGETSINSWFRPNVYIPFAYLIWNAGDLAGRLVCGYPRLVMHSQKQMAVVAIARLLYIPLFFLCNINGEGAIISSDFFYMLLQFTFGLTNGYIGSCAMMNAESYVDDNEKEAAGGFMGLALNLGLAAGSLSSFVLVAEIE